MEYVGVGLRAVAVIIDMVILMVIGYVVALFTGGTTSSGFQLTGMPAILTFLIWLIYYVGLEGTKGATVGKMVMGIRVTTVDGEPIGWGPAVIRNLLRIVDGFLFYLVGAVLVWITQKNQRLGDLAGGTVVVRK